MKLIKPVALAATVVAVSAALVTVGAGRPVTAPGTASAPVATATSSRIRPPDGLPPSISVVGEVVDHGGATSGTITVLVGGDATQVVGNISPQFQVDVTGARSGDMVSLEVAGNGFRYTSLLGSYGRLVSLAGPDRVLTLAESDALRVSPVSTALQFFVERAAEGTPGSDVHLETVLRSVQGDDLIPASVALSKVAKGELALPPGFADGLELLADQQAFRAQVAGPWRQTDLYDAAALAAMPFTAFAAAETRRTTALVSAIADRQEPMSRPSVLVIEPLTEGYLVHSPEVFRDDPRFSGDIAAGGDLALVPEGDLFWDTYRGVCSSGVGQRIDRTTLTGESHRILRRGGSVDLWMTVTHYEQRPINCPEDPPGGFTYSVATMRAAVDLGRAPPMANVRRFTGLRSLPHFCVAGSGHLQACDAAALHRFEAGGTGSTIELGPKVDQDLLPVLAGGTSAFTWSVPSPNTMRTSHAAHDVRYWTVDPGNPLVTGLVYVAEVASGDGVQTKAGYASMIHGHESSLLVPRLGTWRTSGSQQQLEPYLYDDSTMTMVRRITRPPGSLAVFSHQFPRNPQRDSQQTWSWQSFQGRTYETQVTSEDGFAYPDCESALADGATTCSPLRARYFRPLARSENRLYGIEEQYNIQWPGEPPVRGTNLAAYEDLE